MLPEGATRQDIETLRHQLGFDRPLAIQYLDYLAQLARFDLGQSLVQRVPVLDIMAVRRDTRLERVLMALVLVGQSMPTFWSGILLILLFAVTLGAMPSSGVDGIRSVVLPAVALGAL